MADGQGDRYGMKNCPQTGYYSPEHWRGYESNGVGVRAALIGKFERWHLPNCFKVGTWPHDIASRGIQPAVTDER